VNSTYAATANSPAIRQTFFIDQVTDSVIVVVFFLKAVADVYIGRAGNAHGSSAFRLLWTILARAMDLVGGSEVCCASGEVHMSSTVKAILIWVLILVVAVALYNFVEARTRKVSSIDNLTVQQSASAFPNVGCPMCVVR